MSDNRSIPLQLKLADTGTYKYIGEAPPGVAVGDPQWQVSRLTIADSTIQWANKGEGNQVWSNYASLTYS